MSFFHGVVTYNLRKEKVKRITDLPNLVPDVPREQYLLDSAHHGIALSGNDKRLCIAGTMSSYATVIGKRQLAQAVARAEADPEGREALLVDHVGERQVLLRLMVGHRRHLDHLVQEAQGRSTTRTSASPPATAPTRSGSATA